MQDNYFMIRILKKEVKAAGSINAFAKKYKVDRPSVSNMLNGKKPMQEKIAKVLGYTKFTMWKKL